MGITLVALVITIIILLILAGVAISQLTNSGLFAKVQDAKEKQQNAQDLENERLEEYEKQINLGANSKVSSNREGAKSFKITLLYDGATNSGTITFKDGHNINEFDAIRFLHGISGNAAYFETEYLKDSWNYIISNHANVPHIIGLYSFGSRTLDLGDVKETGFSISKCNDDAMLYRVYGINY